MVGRRGLWAILLSLVLGLFLPAAGGVQTTLVGAAHASTAAVESTAHPDQIAWITTFRPDDTYAGDGGVWVGYGPGHVSPDCCNSYRALVTFDLAGIPSTAIVSNVTLRATVITGHGTGSATYNVIHVTQAWSELGVDWNSQPSRADGWLASTSVSTMSGSVSWSSTDLKDRVQRWVNGQALNYGLYLKRGDDTATSQHDRFFQNLELVITYSASTRPDLVVSFMETVQVVQDWNHSVPLVKGKRTVVRVYVSACCQSSNVANVPVKLEGKRGSTSLGSIGPTQPSSNSMSIPGTPVNPLTLRGEETRTFNFVLPTTWTNEADLILIATVNKSQRVSESNYNNNTWQRTVHFNQRPDLEFVGVIVWGTTETGTYYPPVSRSHFDAHIEWTKRVYPVPNVGMWRVTGYDLLEYDPVRQADGVLADLYQWRTSMAAASSALNRSMSQIIWYGLDSWSTRYFGLSSTGLEATGHDTPVGQGVGEIMAHEMGHCDPFERLHASDQCTDWPDSNAGNFCDINYPLANGCIEEYGFDTVAMKAIGPEDASNWTGASCRQDVMSYGHPSWMSSYTYKALYYAADDLVEPSQAQLEAEASAAPHAELLATGLVTQDDQVRARPFYVISTTAPIDADPGTGGYSLALEDGASNILAQRFFDPRWTSGPAGGTPSVGLWGVRLPWNPATVRIVLRKGSQELGTRQVSAHMPQVTVLSPAGGETWSGQQQVQWTSSDADGGSLVHMVLYSRDGGQSWRPVGINITGTTYTLDADKLPGATQARIRVIASDGVRSNHGDSGTFSVAGKAPELRLQEPAPGQAYPNPYAVSLNASAYDIEDGPLGGSQVTWSSNRDGVLGSGAELVVAQLSAGAHMLSVTVTDQDGLTNTVSVTVSVAADWPYSAVLPLLIRG